MLPTALPWTFALLLALLFGSFLNVCIARLPQHRSIVRPGSHCPRCQAPIRARDNLPILSWLLLGGRCRNCGRPIALRYPLVEAGYTALVAASIARFGFSAEALAASIFCFLALGLLVMDLETMLLPDAFTLPGLGLGLAWALVAPGSQASNSSHWLPALVSSARLGMTRLAVGALNAAAYALLLMMIRWAYYAVRRRHGLGLGDVKLVAMLAAWLGVSRVAVCLMLAVVSAAVYGLVLIAADRIWRDQATIQAASPLDLTGGALRLPLGAFLCGAAIYALFFGSQTLIWYFKFWL